VSFLRVFHAAAKYQLHDASSSQSIKLNQTLCLSPMADCIQVVSSFVLSSWLGHILWTPNPCFDKFQLPIVPNQQLLRFSCQRRVKPMSIGMLHDVAKGLAGMSTSSSQGGNIQSISAQLFTFALTNTLPTPT
jgi:hypothetical protein